MYDVRFKRPARERRGLAERFLVWHKLPAADQSQVSLGGRVRAWDGFSSPHDVFVGVRQEETRYVGFLCSYAAYRQRPTCTDRNELVVTEQPQRFD